MIWQGDAALSAFRLEALTRELSGSLPSYDKIAVCANFVYFLELEADLDPIETKRACALLEARAVLPENGGIYVTPRKGTISPWSTKASQIFQISGISKVKRVERGIRYMIRDASGHEIDLPSLAAARDVLFDRMTEGLYAEVSDIFVNRPPSPGRVFDVLSRGRLALDEANKTLGLAMSEDEILYLERAYAAAGRNPTDTELVMFGQVNSEHCRHKIFNAEWVIDGENKDSTLFGMIRETHKAHPSGTLVAYKDNSSVVEGFEADAFCVDPQTKRYGYVSEQLDLLMKVETHNHPTAISPFPGAATGVGGEIRDESATGVGSRTKAGISGFMVSDLRIPGHVEPWEADSAALPFPSRLASPLEIMLEGPIGGARFGNEFGRPQLAGFFRTFETTADGRRWGYHKPIMLAGGMGSIRRRHISKREIPPGSWIVQIGGPAMRIGLGGGAASSMATGANDEALDFDSVQRGNAEMERRAQEVIDTCVAMGEKNPILSIHDIGAGGLSNACPEIVEKTGAVFQLRKVHNEEPSMSPMEIWCCEAQERYMLAVRFEDRKLLENICARERCPVAFIGVATGNRRLILEDEYFADRPIDMDIDVLLGKPPKMRRDVKRRPFKALALDLRGISAGEAFERILRLPSVASKNFLVTIADRSVTGLVHRDQMTGPFQLPLADCAVTTTGFHSFTGESMAVGERTPIAVVNAEAAGRIAVGEAFTNIAASAVGEIGNVKLSANWMCACGEDGEDARLFDTVHAVATELCIKLGVAIPVGKDSLSMRTIWEADGRTHRQQAPLSLIVSAFSPVSDVRKTLTPDLKRYASKLMLLDAAAGRARLGGSALAQVLGQVGDETPDLDDPAHFAAIFACVQGLVRDGLLLAYHDRSDGGVAVTLAEMAFGGGIGIAVDLPGDAASPMAALFSEELGAVLQVADGNVAEVCRRFEESGLARVVSVIGSVTDDYRLSISVGGKLAISGTVSHFRSIWSELSYRMQSLRDNPLCAREEFDVASDVDDPGMSFCTTFDPDEWPEHISVKQAPRVAILREQGVNGHIEMAAAFDAAGFEAVDMHMTDLYEGRVDLANFNGLAACGGFSYGDVLGSGTGWASGILLSNKLVGIFKEFFWRPDTFTLGVCNGCQMISQLKNLIPGAELWPRFVRNVSEQFEARFSTVELMPSPSIFFRGMEGSRLPIAVAHGDGYARFNSDETRQKLLAASLASVRYVDNIGCPAERYPFNPNGSCGGLTGFTSADGRATIMMPHPERGFRSTQLSYRGGLFRGECGPWMRMFRNAYVFATEHIARKENP